jgi:hypothetical protein
MHPDRGPLTRAQKVYFNTMVDRPKHPSKRATRLVEGLIRSTRDLHRRPSQHAITVADDKKRALLNYIMQLENSPESAGEEDR